MVYVYLVFTLIFRWNISLGQIIRNQTFCENGKDLRLTCPTNEVISHLFVMSGEDHCTNGDNDDCYYNADIANLKRNCLNTSQCTISTLIFSYMERSPICIQTEYECNCLGWLSYEKEMSPCPSSLEQISCPWYFGCKITIKKVILPDKIVCPQPNCNINSMLIRLCSGNGECKQPKNNACLFHPKFVNIQYTCTGNSESLFTDATSNQWSLSSSAQVIDATSNSLETPVTYSTDVNSSEISKPVLLLDVDGRVLIYSSSENETVTVCGIGWDDKDAMVVCRYLYNSRQGKAKAVTTNKDSNFETIPYAIHCTGNETDPFLCSYTYFHYGCNTSTVAAVACSEDTNTTNLFSSHDAYDALSNNLNLGVAVGVSVGVAVLIFIAVTVFLLIKRSRLTHKDKLYSSDITNGGYIGNQALPNFPNISKHTHSTDDDDSHCKHNDVHSQNASSNNYLSSSSYSLNTLETETIKSEQVNGGYKYANSIGVDMHNTSFVTYACSEEGIYDKAKTKSHVQTELNVYSHSIDTAYDTSDLNRNQEHTVDTYDHFFGQKNDNNYDIAIRK